MVKRRALTETTYYVLASFLYNSHGYAIKKFLEENTEMNISLGQGTLYGIINNLENKKYIKLVSKDKKNKYQLTDLGIKVLKEEFERIKFIANFNSTFLEPKLGGV